MKKLFLLVPLISLIFLMVSGGRPVLATVSCTTQYGGGQTCVATGQLLVNKKIWDPASQVFKDNLGLADHRFQAGEEVIFSIDIKNVGDNTLNNVQFADTLPAFLVWSAGDALSSAINTLTPGQTITKVIRARVINNLAAAVTCDRNIAVATAPEGISDRDTAQLCAGTVPKAIPAAGPEMAVLALLPGLGGLGWYLRKITS
ncbi:DUF11 domain-containing protein [Candidatus Gottesmanbacteria bacterium]|nr:DUF11 domain-containing protein [Candidatus Gottesmanbacteria bacterium]